MLEDLGFSDLPEFGFGSFGVDPIARARMIDERLDRQQVLELEGRPYRYWHRWSPRPLKSSDFHSPGSSSSTIPRGTPSARFRWSSMTPDDSSSFGRFRTPRQSPTDRRSLTGHQLWSLPVSIRSPSKPPTLSCRFLRTAMRSAPGGRRATTANAGSSNPVRSAAALFYFEVSPTSAIDAPERTTAEPSMGAFGGFLWLTMWVLAVVLAGRNIRLGRGDRRAAFRFALVMAFCYLLIEGFSLLTRGHLGFDQLQEILWDRAGGHIVLHAAHVWFMYLAIEPLCPADLAADAHRMGQVSFRPFSRSRGRARGPHRSDLRCHGDRHGLEGDHLRGAAARHGGRSLIAGGMGPLGLCGWGNQLIGLLNNITSPCCPSCS